MDGWDANEDEGVFSNVPIEESTARLVALMEKHRPHVVVTYDENGGYGHPDHIQAHRVAVAAAKITHEEHGFPAKFYHTAIPRSRFRELVKMMRESGEDFGGEEPPEDLGTPDELVTTVVDVAPYAERKRKALVAHASQGDNIFFLRMSEEIQQRVFGAAESFTRTRSDVAAPEDEDDLFAGLR
jgi:LmbE family N-acetylglucosaminyl deacetylase